MRLSDVIKFQKALALAAGASNPHEAKAAELAVRRLVKTRDLDPTRVPDQSFVSKVSFTDNALLQKLRDEYREQHPHKRKGSKPKAAKPSKGKPAAPDPVSMYEGMFDDFEPKAVNAKGKPKPTAKPVFNTKPTPKSEPKPRSDRNRDRHSPGYMREYMREYMRRRRARRP
jgi:hypothetical protein